VFHRCSQTSDQRYRHPQSVCNTVHKHCYTGEQITLRALGTKLPEGYENNAST